MSAARTSWSAGLLLACATAAFVASIVLLLVPVGQVADSDCGWPLQAAFRHSAVCSDPGQRRVAISVILAVVAVAFFTVAWRRRRRKAISA